MPHHAGLSERNALGLKLRISEQDFGRVVSTDMVWGLQFGVKGS